ncbi:MAG: hypothetical protein HRT72_09345 [Flavobacteriales bacterium]|nr:hypothetical protein [Flavobacteriales bacterium]
MNTQNKKDFPNWEDVPASSGMKVPAGYFECVEDSILQKISEVEQGKTKIIPIHRSHKAKTISIASAVAAAFIGAILFFNNPVKNEVNVELANEILLDEWTALADIDDYFIAENFTTEELSNIHFEDKSSVSAEAAYQYMLDESFSEFLLYEQF